MIIALDAMGGDFAPTSAIEGGIMAARKFDDSTIVLIGESSVIESHLSSLEDRPKNIQIIHASEVIEMGEHPALALRQKPQSSIAIGFNMLAAGDINAFCSAGNTGAMLVGALLSVKAIKGVQRPAIAGYVPKPDGTAGIMLDAGANAELKAEHLVQFAELGYIYAQSVMEIPNPTVGLMNLGEEEGKGSAILQSVYQSLKTHPFINFIGNLEGRDVFTSKADVIITDGLVGNVILKLAESVYELLMTGNTPLDSFFTKLNYELHGGSPIVGINGNVVIGHGRSTPLAIKNMVAQCRRMIRADVNQKISKAIESMANPPQN